MTMADVPYFRCTRINSSTFLIVENDKYEEHPFIYVKLYNDPALIVLLDVGCGGGSESQANSSDLRVFLETHPVDSNNGQPLNPQSPKGAVRHYTIICTHCHYDHILGLNHFANAAPTIIASSHDKSFIEENLPENSLCKSLKVSVPRYNVSHWADDLEKISYDGTCLHLQILHTPGHTPDELAVYDEIERHLYVGDSFYERVAGDKSYEQAIIFPREGNLVDYMGSLYKLFQFVEAVNAEPSKPVVKISCGHITYSVEGKGVLAAVRQLFLDIIDDKVPIMKIEKRSGEEFALWRQEGEPRFSVTAPTRCITDARKSRRDFRDLEGAQESLEADW